MAMIRLIRCSFGAHLALTGIHLKPINVGELELSLSLSLSLYSFNSCLVFIICVIIKVWNTN